MTLTVASLVVSYAFQAVGGRWPRWRLRVSRRPPEHLNNPAPSDASPQVSVAQGPCGADQVFVEGQYCTHADEHCSHWLDDPKLPFARCGTFDAPSRCLGGFLTLRFCIDRYEYTPTGKALPENWASFALASQVCAQRGERMCSETEWNFACEGEEMRPYPYGFTRQPVCNQDRLDLLVNGPERQSLRDWRESSYAHPLCVSPFGVYNMVGNLDEPVLRDSAPPDSRFRVALKGGWWMPARNRCRPATVGHDIYYRGFQVGIRCCADAAR